MTRPSNGVNLDRGYPFWVRRETVTGLGEGLIEARGLDMVTVTPKHYRKSEECTRRIWPSRWNLASRTRECQGIVPDTFINTIRMFPDRCNIGGSLQDLRTQWVCTSPPPGSLSCTNWWELPYFVFIQATTHGLLL